MVTYSHCGRSSISSQNEEADSNHGLGLREMKPCATCAYGNPDGRSYTSGGVTLFINGLSTSLHAQKMTYTVAMSLAQQLAQAWHGESEGVSVLSGAQEVAGGAIQVDMNGLTTSMMPETLLRRIFEDVFGYISTSGRSAAGASEVFFSIASKKTGAVYAYVNGGGE